MVSPKEVSNSISHELNSSYDLQSADNMLSFSRSSASSWVQH